MTAPSLAEYKARYSLIDEILFTDQIQDYFKSANPNTIFLNQGTNSDSQLKTLIPETGFLKDICPDSEIDFSFMHDLLAESRVIKNDEEIEILRWASKITCEAHCNVMRNCKPGMRES